MKALNRVSLIIVCLLLNLTIGSIVHAQTYIEEERERVLRGMQEEPFVTGDITEDEADEILSEWEGLVLDGIDITNHSSFLIKPEFYPDGVAWSHGVERQILYYLEDFKEAQPSGIVSRLQSNRSKPIRNDNIYPYAVDIDELPDHLSFYLDGVNNPNLIELWLDEQIVELKYLDYSTKECLRVVTFNMEMDYIPTLEKRVFDYERINTRNVKVNTRIKLDAKESSTNKDEFYLFINRNGNISLMTPNFAGNVTNDYMDVMLEYMIQ